MSKKTMVLGVVAMLLLALVVPNAFAATNNNDSAVNNNGWFDQMFDWHTQWLDQAVNDGQIDQQQAQAWKEHFNYMRDFHNQYGFGMMGSMMGNYGGQGGGWGMMGGYPAQPQVQ